MANITRAATDVPQRQHNEDRLRRAKSWHERSQSVASDDEKFIFLWIAFNAAYGGGSMIGDSEQPTPEAERFDRFLVEVVNRDTGNVIEQLLWGTYSGPIHVLLMNQYAFEPFWRAVWDSSRARTWERGFQNANQRVATELGRRRVDRVLKEVFMRLYTLRNQIIHGGATYGSGWGRPQLRDGCAIMSSLVPVILEIMETDIERNPESMIWGKVAYPRINYEPES